MFKRFFLVVIAGMLLSTQVMATDNRGLALAMNELQYSLTVEWDQQDQAFYQKSLEKFNRQIQELQNEGMLTQDIIDHTLANIKDAKVAKSVEGAFNLLRMNRATPNEAQKYMQDLLAQQYATGAAWDNSAGDVIIGLAVLGIVAYAVFYGIRYTCIQRCERDCGILVCTEECRSTCF